MASKVAAVAEKIGTSRWRWIKPDVYPLLATLGIGIACAVYSSARNFANNPEVRLNKVSRNDAASELPVFEESGKRYKTSVYRALAYTRGDKTGIF